MKKLLIAVCLLASTSFAALSTSAQSVTVWAVNPPVFDFANDGMVIQGPGVAFKESAGWGQVFMHNTPLQNPMPSTNLADYTFSATINSTAQNNGAGFRLSFRNADNQQVANYQWQWPTLLAGEHTYTNTLDQFVALTPFSGPEAFASITQVHYIVGGLTNIGSTYTFSQQSLTAVPEPSTYALLLGLGILSLVVVRRRLQR